MKKILLLTALISYAAQATTVPYYNIRSQNYNAARELVGAGWNTQINLCGKCEWYGNFAITPEYTRSFKPEQICCCLFDCFQVGGKSCNKTQQNCCTQQCQSWVNTITCCWAPYCTSCCDESSCCNSCCTDNCCYLAVSGSQVENRGSTDLLADYFGLPTDYKSIVGFKPEISNFLVNFSFYLGLDEWIQGLYFKLWAPVVHTNWDINMSECIVDEGTNDHKPGYFNGQLLGETPNYYGIKRYNLVPNFTAFMTGCSSITSDDISFIPLNYARMGCCADGITALADLRAALGWNFICNTTYSIGLNVQAAAPTGTRPHAKYLFEPIVGNGHHWELGGALTARWTPWRSCDECKYVELFLDANVSHMMNTRQIRTFDLCGKPLSRYMLASRMGTPVSELTAGINADNLSIPDKQFKGIYEPIANISTFSVDVSVSLQADIVVMLQGVLNNFSFDVGYELWGRTCEDIDFRCDCPCQFDTGRYFLKGDAFMYGFEQADGSITTTAVALSASQSQATICAGTNSWPNGFDNLNYVQNPGVDNRQLAWDSTTTTQLVMWDFVHSTTASIYTSRNPVPITLCDINIDKAGTKGISHKFFAHIDYTWNNHDDCHCWVPYLGIGGEIEFGQCSDDTCNGCQAYCNSCAYSCTPACGGLCADNCSCCTSCALSQWGVWIKGGIGFH